MPLEFTYSKRDTQLSFRQIAVVTVDVWHIQLSQLPVYYSRVFFYTFHLAHFFKVARGVESRQLIWLISSINGHDTSIADRKLVMQWRYYMITLEIHLIGSLNYDENYKKRSMKPGLILVGSRELCENLVANPFFQIILYITFPD